MVWLCICLSTLKVSTWIRLASPHSLKDPLHILAPFAMSHLANGYLPTVYLDVPTVKTNQVFRSTVPPSPSSSFWHQTLQGSTWARWSASLSSLTVQTSSPSSDPKKRLNTLSCYKIAAGKQKQLIWMKLFMCNRKWRNSSHHSYFVILFISLTLPSRDLNACLISCLWALLLLATMSIIASSSVPVVKKDSILIIYVKSVFL